MRPGVFYTQSELNQVVSGYSGTVAGICGNAKWGPVDTLTLFDNFNKFIQVHGKPISPSETPMHYQVLGWFNKGKGIYVVRPKGNCKYGGVEADTVNPLEPLSSLSNIPPVPSGDNVIGLYHKYPGAHPDGDIYVEIFDKSASDGTFTIKVGVKYLDSGHLDSGDPLYEEHRVSVINTAKDGFGRSKYLNDVLERDSTLIAGRVKVSALVSEVPLNTSTKIQLTGNVYLPDSITVSNIVIAYEKFISLSASTIDLLIPGNFDEDVLNKIVSVSELRGDCFNILSPDVNGVTWTLEGITDSGWKSGISTLSWQSAAYAMYYKIKDEYNDRDVYIPSAGFIAGAFAYNDRDGDVFYAPAGSRRGTQNVKDLGIFWTDADQNSLYDDNLNFVTKDNQYGITIQGQKTLYGVQSALQRINVARLILRIKRDLLAFLKDFLYEFNTDQTRISIYNGIYSYLQLIKSKQGLYDFKVVCDTTNNPDAIIDTNKLIVDIYLKPVKVAEYLYLNSIITSTGVDLSSIVSVPSI